MNITQIKAQLGLTALTLVAAKNNTEWLNHWSESLGNKFVVSIPTDLLPIIEDNPDIDTLQVQTGILETSNGDIASYRIINPTPAVVVATL